MKWAQEFREERSRLMKQKWSDPSYHKKQAGAMKGKTAWNRNMKTGVFVKCLQCGTEKYCSPSRAKTFKFCNRRCYFIAARGENWKPKTVSKAKDRLERLKFRNEIQRLVLERDSYTCQFCHNKGGKLQVDHIQSWAEYVELRFDINNCRTLCMACHYKVTFGRELPEGVTDWGHNLSQIRG